MSISKLCFSFSGRINRAQYWGGVGAAYAIIILYVLIIIAAVPHPDPSGVDPLGVALGVLASILYSFIYCAVAVKRLHDLDYSGKWVLTIFIPVVGVILFFVWGILEGDARDNRFGPKL